MTTLLGVRGDGSFADAYGTLAADSLQTLHLIIQVTGEDSDNQATEVSFDDTDIQGTFLVDGHPGVIGLWLASYLPTGVGYMSDGETPAHWTPSWVDGAYIVPDLRPAANGYMYTRGHVWPPWDGVTRPYPYERAYP